MISAQHALRRLAELDSDELARRLDRPSLARLA